MAEIKHHGVPGMKWGVRKDRETSSRRSPRGPDPLKSKGLVLDRNRTPAFTKFLAKLSPKIQETLSNSKSFKIKREGKTIGELDLYRESKKSLNIVWVSIGSKNEGRGYGTAVMKGVKKYAEQEGYDKLTLEVPGNSPNARHIYEKLGFKEVSQLSSKEEDIIWGGLTRMELDIKKRR